MVLCVQPPFLFPVKTVGAPDVETDYDYYIGVLLALATAVMGAMANV